MILGMLGIVDIIGGTVLALYGFDAFSGNAFVLLLSLVILIKGLSSYLMAVANRFYLDLMGIADILSGLMLLSLFFGLGAFFFPYAGIILSLKGFYSLVMDVVQ